MASLYVVLYFSFSATSGVTFLSASIVTSTRIIDDLFPVSGRDFSFSVKLRPALDPHNLAFTEY